MTGIDEVSFRQVLGHYATGVTLITAIDRGEPVGMAANSFTSVSLDPPLVAFFPGRSSTTWPRIEAAGAFCVNLLLEGQEELCRIFATKGAPRFNNLAWQRAPVTGSPVLDNVLGWIDCQIEEIRPAGDHSGVLGRVVDLAVNGGRPLLFYRGGYGRFEA